MPAWPLVASASSSTPPSSSTAASATQPTQHDIDALAAQLTSAHIEALIAEKVSPPVVRYVVDRVFAAVDVGLNRTSPGASSASSSATAAQSRRKHTRPDDGLLERRNFANFLATVFRSATVSMSGVLGALVYIERSIPYLSIAVTQWAPHRVLLGALIVASKYLNDASLKNAHWAMCTNIFGRNDIARIEREFLTVLDFELAVRDEHLRRQCARMVLAGAVRMPKPVQKKPVQNAVEIVDEPMATEHPALAAPAPAAAAANAVDTLPRKIVPVWKERESVRRSGRMSGSRSDNSHLETYARPRPEKRHSDDDMDLDIEDYTRRRQRRRAEVYLPPAPSSRLRGVPGTASAPIPVLRSAVAPTTSPASDVDSCGSCSTSSSMLSTAGSAFSSSPASATTPGSSPDGNSPYTPPHSANANAPTTAYSHPGPPYKQLHLLEHLPRAPLPPVPVPTPVSQLYGRGPAPSALPTLPPLLPPLPFPAHPLDGPTSAYQLARPPSSSVAYSLYPPSFRPAAMAA